jgi:hypothetical protein
MIHLPLFNHEPSDYDSDSELATWEPYAAALRELPVPDRPRDFVLSAQMAAKLRPAQHRRRLGRVVLVPLTAALVVGVILPRLFSPASTSAPFIAPAVVAPERASLTPDNGKVAASPAPLDVNMACQTAMNALGSGAPLLSPSPSSTPSVVLASPSPPTPSGPGLIPAPASAPSGCDPVAP